MKFQHWKTNQEALLHLIQDPRLGVISDFDGTLSPFVGRPQDAAITSANASALDALAETGAVVALLSGRSVIDLQRRFNRPWLVYSGNHGLGFWRNDEVQVAAQVQPWIEPLQALMRAFGEPKISGVFAENKGTTASIHYRMAGNIVEARQQIHDLLLPLCEEYGFRLNEGQLVWEIKPPVDLNKGTAAELIVNDFQLDSVLFLGDDWTDVTVMQRLRAIANASHGRMRALSIGVMHPTSPPAIFDYCDLVAEGVEDVEDLLSWINLNRSQRLAISV